MVYSTRLPWEIEGLSLDRLSGITRRRVRVRGGRVEEAETTPAVPRYDAGGLKLSNDGHAVWRWNLPDEVWLLPGFVDAHTHLIGVGLAPLKPDLSSARSKREAMDLLAHWISLHPGQSPLIAEGWDQSTWSEAAVPTREELDRIAPTRPLACRRVCGHIALFNSAALALIAEADPPWPNLDRGSGLAKEELPLALPALWPPTEAEYDHAVDVGLREAWRKGVTQAHEMGHPASWRAFGRAEVAGRLGLRMVHFVRSEHLHSVAEVGPVAGSGGDWLRFGGIKFFLDGSFGGRSAALRAEVRYRDQEARGLLLFRDDELLDLLRRAREMDFPVALHAIGDAAIDQALRAFDSVARSHGAWPSPGPRIEHAELLAPDLLERAMKQSVCLSMQPNFTARWQGEGELYEQALGADLARGLNPFRSAAETGRLAFGSDTMPIDPILGLRGALGHPLTSERLDLAHALEAYTRGGASAVRRPFGWSDLGAGDVADFVGVRLPELTRRWRGASGASLALDGAELLNGAEVVLTVVGGEVRYWSGGLLTKLEAKMIAPQAVS